MAERGRINTRAFIPVAHSNGMVDLNSRFASGLYLLDQLSEEDDDEDLCDSTWSDRTTPISQIPASHGWSDVTLTGSYASWEDHEEGVLDRVASEQVGLMFDAIDQSLYEGQDTGFQQMDKECVNWRESFPHLRIKGQHLLDSLEDGTEIVDPIVPNSNSGYTTSTPRNMGTTANSNELGITGESMKLCSPPPVMMGDTLSPPGLHYEEILASDGEVEEYFAYNYSSSDRDSMKRSSTYSHHRSSHKIPPVSPSACLKDTVTALLFDQIWTEVAGVLYPLIKSSCQKTSLSREDGNHLLPSQGIVPIHEFFLPKNSIQPNRGQQGIQMMKHRPLVPPAQLPSSGVSFPQTHSTDLPSLRNVMTIKPVALQQRIPSSTLPPSLSVNNTVFQPPPSVVDISDSNPGLHDFSKILPNNSRHVSFIHTPVPPRLSEPKLTSGKIGNKRNTLKPLEVPRTPGIPLIEDDLKEFSGLRGQRLVRHTQLPPLDPTQFDMTTKSPHGFRSYGNKGQPHQVTFSQRIVSAVTDTRGDSGGISNKKNPYLGGGGGGVAMADPRPNSSQTFHRSETPLTRRGSNNSVGALLPPASSSPIKVIGYAANLHIDPVLWEAEHENDLR